MVILIKYFSKFKTDEHADLIFKLRSLLDKANEINMQNTVKLIQSSRALQIIQSRLAYKQALYSDALLNNKALTTNNDGEINPEVACRLRGESIADYLSEEDNESYVSADSVSNLFISLKDDEMKNLILTKFYIRFQKKKKKSACH